MAIAEGNRVGEVDSTSAPSEDTVKDSRGRRIHLVHPNSASRYLAVLPVKDQESVNSSGRRQSLLERAIRCFEERFLNQTATLFDFTSEILWLRSRTAPFNSAAFHELPHCTVVSDGALFTIAPTILVERRPSSYATFENLYHESLHHKLSAAIVLLSNGYVDNAGDNDRLLTLQVRGIRWSLPNVLQAAFVYLHLIELRLLVGNIEGESHDTGRCLKWANDALAINSELCEVLRGNRSLFRPYLRAVIEEMSEEQYRLERSSSQRAAA
jgi:hypothetical protein